MTSTNMYIPQSEWDAMSQALSTIFDVDYVPSNTEPYIVTPLYSNNSGHFNLGIKRTAEQKKAQSTRQIGMRYSHLRNEKIGFANSKNWLITDPIGITYRVFNLRQFCREKNLNQSSMTMVAKGKFKQHKGWTCQKI